MAELQFGPTADRFLSELELEPDRNEAFLQRLDAALDRLEADPGDAWCRRRRFQNIGVWGIAVVHAGEEWLILWEPDKDDGVVVHAIARAP